MTLAISVNGSRAIACNVLVPGVGAWVANVDFDDVVALTGRVELAIGTTKLSGTVDPTFSGTFQSSRKIRIIAGANGWRNSLPAKHYHNDLGIKPSHILTDVAGSVGESIVVADDARIGVDYIRFPGPASSVLRKLRIAWWVDYAGVTQTGPHPSSDATDYDLLHYDARNRIAELAVDDVSKVVVGSTLRGRLALPLTVRDLEIRIEKDKTRAIAWGTTP